MQATILAPLLVVTAACGGLAVTPNQADSGAPTGSCADVADHPVVVAAVPNGVDSLVTDGTMLYWTDQLGNINAVSVRGGTPTVLTNVVPQTLCGPPIGACQSLLLALDATNVYVDLGGTENSQTIEAIPKAGGALRQVSSANVDGSFVISAGALLWSEPQGEGAPSANQLYRVSLAGGAPTSLGGAPTPIASNLVADTTSLYWGDIGGAIYKLPLSGGSAMQLASPQERPTNAIGISVAGDQVYYYSNPEAVGGCVCPGPQPALQPSTVNGVPIVGGDVTVLASGPTSGNPQMQVGGIAADDDYVYWMDDASNALDVVPVRGGATQTLAGGLSINQSVEIGPVLDSCSVYFVASGAIERVAKPR
jgi:hypothetical protein